MCLIISPHDDPKQHNKREGVLSNHECVLATHNQKHWSSVELSVFACSIESACGEDAVQTMFRQLLQHMRTNFPGHMSSRILLSNWYSSASQRVTMPICVLPVLSLFPLTVL